MQAEPTAVIINGTDYLTQASQLSDRDHYTVISTSQFTHALLLHITRSTNIGRHVKDKVDVCPIIVLRLFTGNRALGILELRTTAQ